jgi:hypothetical protein
MIFLEQVLLDQEPEGQQWQQGAVTTAVVPVVVPRHLVQKTLIWYLKGALHFLLAQRLPSCPLILLLVDQADPDKRVSFNPLFAQVCRPMIQATVAAASNRPTGLQQYLELVSR